MVLGENRAERLLIQTLKELRLGTDVKVVRQANRLADVALRVGKERHLFQLNWAGEGFPQDVVRVLQRIPRNDAVPVVCAVSFSPGAVDLLRKSGVSYLDEAGRARIFSPPGLLLVREDMTSQPHRKRSAFVWSPGLAATAELLLSSQWDELPPISAIAALLPVSMATVGKALQAFDREGWTESIGAARGVAAERRLVDRAGLLGSWSRWEATREREDALRLSASWKEPWTFLSERLAPALPSGKWCLTGWGAAELLAPYSATVPTLHLYIAEDSWFEAADAALALRGVRQVDQGARISLMPLVEQLQRLGEERFRWPVASTARVYADLLREGTRGQDAAEHLREVRLEF